MQIISELRTAFELAVSKEPKKEAAEETKEPVPEEQIDNKKKAKKVKAPAGLGLGKGSRQFFDFLIASDLLKVDTARCDVAYNKELSSVMSEILVIRNEERRRPKCAKGTRDMTPL
jgi:hypothetical protein